MAFLKGIKQMKIQYLFSNLTKEEISEWRTSFNPKKSDLKSSNFFQSKPIEVQKHSLPLRDESTLETPLNSRLKLAMGFSDRVYLLKNSNKQEIGRERSNTKNSNIAVGKTQKLNSLGKKSEKSSVTIRNNSKANTRILSGTTSKLFRSLKTSNLHNLQSIVPNEPSQEKESMPKFEYFQVKDLINKRIRNDTYESNVNLAKEYREIRV